MATAAPNFREQQLASQLAQSASLAQPAPTTTTPFPDNDAALAAEVKKIADTSEERARMRTEEAREQYDAQVRANLVRAKEQEQEKRDAVTRYHTARQ